MEGKEYGFFRCNRPEAEVREIVPRVGGRGVNSRLELFTIREMARRQLDPELMGITLDAGEQGINYVLEGTCKGALNSDGIEVTTALNRMYQSHLFHPEKKEKFYGNAFYDENGEYVERN